MSALMRLLKLLWMSNLRTAPSGYGNQTNLFAPALKNAGHEMTIFAFHGIAGAPMVDQDGIMTLPKLRDAYGNDVIDSHMAFTNADVLITLIDPWVLNPNIYGALNWCAWAPIDGAPALPANVKALKAARWVWAMSKFGQEQLAAAGVESTYVPHGIDTDIFKPGDRAAARARIEKAVRANIGEKFLVVMNAANIGAPSRKGFSEAIEAFKHFSDDVPESMLYIHTDLEGLFEGENLNTTMALYGLDPAKVIFPPLYPYRMGMLPQDYLNAVYNAADVYLQTSHGEGFGIPIVEAQAAGCPAIVTDFSAMSELCFEGWKVPGMLFQMMPGSLHMIPYVHEVVEALRQAHDSRGMEPLRTLARAGALEFDYRTVLDRYMLPALEAMGNDLAQGHERSTAQPVGGPAEHEHKWGATGLYIDGALSVPCQVDGCEAALQVNWGNRVVQGVFPMQIGDIKLDIADDPEGGVAKIVCREIEQTYQLDKLDLKPGDVVVDIGAHVGLVSIYLAKRFPGIEVWAYEPSPDNFDRLLRNLSVNGVSEQVFANQLAVTPTGWEIAIAGNPTENSGRKSAFIVPTPDGTTYIVASTTLADIAKKFERIALLKVDCEGSEYGILEGQGELLKKVDHLRGEFHTNAMLRRYGHSPVALIEEVKRVVPDVVVEVCQMAG